MVSGKARESPWSGIIRGRLRLRDVIAKEDHEDGGVSVSEMISLVKSPRLSGERLNQLICRKERTGVPTFDAG
jgi:hypothetical protein